MRACRTKKCLGRIHSLESLGTHEGPGVRYVIFLQGCLARCLYCQNPDTWDLTSGKLLAPREIFKKISSCLPYIRSSGGGVTVSGGEPLLQTEFLIKLFRLCKKESIHTAIDTSGFCPQNNGQEMISLLKLTDLFIVDLKAADKSLHCKITSRKLQETLSLLDILEKNKKPYWIRQVLVPGLNNSLKDIKLLKEILSGLKYCEKFEFLPYHTLGKHKWVHLGLKYSLGKLLPATEKNINKAQKLLS